MSYEEGQTVGKEDMVDISAVGLLVSEGIIHPVVSVSTLTQFIKYIDY